MSATVVIAGASGFVGRHLAKVLNRDGYNIICVTRRTSQLSASSPYFHETITWDHLQLHGLPQCDAVINLAGENIMNMTRRWDAKFKKDVFTSRTASTKFLGEVILATKTKPKVFITASGVGYYQPSPTEEYTEASSGGKHDFLAQLADAWEKASHLPRESGVRVINLRCGAVLGRDGGVIKNLYWPFYFGLGGPVGDGKQPFPWIHLDDLAHIYKYTLENKQCHGAYNAVAPQIITNAEFTKAFAKAMHRPAVIPVPKIALNVILGKERAKILTDGQKVHPKKIVSDGFGFLFPTIKEACEDICMPTIVHD
ncbi:epimerase family protein SDR39U1-like [Paramacrobiotus metropolitanus]|uniref:epimerase family protein SDR39U1-like n=1 Tax=Paramacrobiotus metropolitanus TaxID=2943436 RepID=UPI00244633A0|nr:epimerase family protein SDR39U1-like [Paramacrobiotus metropolitanus]